ncbi:restriction endonuclease [Methylomagnum sp.]
MSDQTQTAQNYKTAIEQSGKDIYAPIAVGDELWIPTPQLEELLNRELFGLDLGGLPLRTRSKVVKTSVCRALGYPVPVCFKKIKPRFPGQELDIYAQKSRNLQVWNEQLSPTRRYALIRVSDQHKVCKVKVINGQELALLDTTGKITTKYQARLDSGTADRELISPVDTPAIVPHVSAGLTFDANTSPTDNPASGGLLPVAELYQRLTPLIGLSFPDPGKDQERNRGAALHGLVCEALGYGGYGDNGRFPDIRHQLLEVKLQTSPTIDLGLVSPDSLELLDIPHIGLTPPRHCDTRYAVFQARTDGSIVTLNKLAVATGSDFFTRFRRFEGKVQNGKLQIPLPKDFFDR